jgi:branched-subunit amino acid ABC-type transport system permease component
MGIVWAVIPAIFKAFFNTNETLFTLMMNYIAIQFVLFFIKTWDTAGTGKLNPMSYGNLPELLNRYLLPILLIGLVTAIVAVYIKYTKHGFELNLVGESEASAKYAGIDVKWVIIRTMIVSGAIAGLVGFILVAGYNHTVSEVTTDSRGFTGIIVTWMAGMNPLYMILASFFVIFMRRGSSQLITDLGITSSAFQDIIIGIFFFFIIGCEFFVRYKIMTGKTKKKEKKKKSSPLLEGLNKSLEEDSYIPTSEGEANDTFRKQYRDEDKVFQYTDTDDIDDALEASVMDPNDFLSDALEDEEELDSTLEEESYEEDAYEEDFDNSVDEEETLE